MAIQILSPLIIDQIAAGEVIESPASVIKELVHNALDARATRIDIDIASGGLDLIRVTDNGCGMNAEDAFLCIERHATSKMRAIEDLQSLHTMGFRGEALSSIASISRMDLMTSQHEQGIKIHIEAGKIIHSSSYPRMPGTTIEVHTLFYNVPARLAFQKKPAGCTADIVRMLSQLALIRHDVSFHLRQQERTLLQAPKTENLKERITQVLGKEYSAMLSPIETDIMRGFLGSPLYTKPHRIGQYVYINRRYVQAPLIAKAVSAGYGTRIGHQSHPLFVLHLDIDPQTVDINVHPQKKRVRIHNEESLCKTIKELVKEGLQKIEGYVLPAYAFVPRKEWVLSEEIAPLELREEKPEPPSLPFTKVRTRPLCLVGRYIIVEEMGALWVLDVEGVKKRCIHDTLISPSSIEKQMLLLPISLTFSPQDAIGFEAHMDILNGMGFEVRLAGKNHFFVDAIPSCLTSREAEHILRDFSHKDVWDKEHLAHIAADVHAKSACTLDEGWALFEKVHAGTLPATSIKGAPLLTQVTSYVIETLLFASK